jgi:peroxiredoxin
MMRPFHAKIASYYTAHKFALMRRWAALLSLTIGFFSCGKEPISSIPLRDLDEQAARIDPSKSPFTVILFLSPECPLCLNYTLNLKELQEDFPSEKVRLVGVFSGKWFSAEEVREFRTRYALAFPMLFDDHLALAKLLDATVTPEVFLLDSTGRVLYSGAIDNWVNDLGKKKLEVTEHYLRDAISAALEWEKVNVRKTRAVGCLIE